MIQQGDVLLFQTNDDGDINVVDGITEMTGSFETMVYLCLFGGNEEDDGSPNNPNSWWGNIGEVDPDFQYRSETQNILRGLAASSANLLRVEQAMLRDLQVFLNKKIASSVEVFASIPDVNKIQLRGSIFAEGVEFTFNFTENWRASNGL